jgi:replicative DNA helicase
MTQKDSGERLEKLKNYSGEDEIISSREMKIRLGAQKQQLYVDARTKIPTLDSYLEGCRDGELYAVSGPTKMGKTLLCQTFTANFAEQNIYSLWFSYEVPARQFLSQFPNLPLIYMPAKLKPHAMPWVEERIMESFLKYHTRVIFIDHLHFLFDIARAKSPSLEIGSVIRKLKTIAVGNNFVIFLLCHTTKGKSEENLSYESIRDSSFISQESDCVLMVKRTPEKGDNRSRVRVEFNRRTGVLEKIVELEKIGGYLREVTQTDFRSSRHGD